MLDAIAKEILPKEFFLSEEYKRVSKNIEREIEQDRIKHEAYIEDVKILLGKVTAYRREVEDEEKQKAIEDLQK